METKHTPGPWHWSKDTMENRCDITLEPETSVYPVLYCCVKPREPNANLIAAAPELLEALKAMRMKYGEYACEACDAADAAIAKAIGKNNEL